MPIFVLEYMKIRPFTEKAEISISGKQRNERIKKCNYFYVIMKDA